MSSFPPTDYRGGLATGGGCTPAPDTGGGDDEGHTSRVHNNASPHQKFISKVWNDAFLPQHHWTSTADPQGNTLLLHNRLTTSAEGSQSTSRVWATTTACMGQARSLQRVKWNQKETELGQRQRPQCQHVSIPGPGVSRHCHISHPSLHIRSAATHRTP